MKINRYVENPLITPKDIIPYHEGFEVIGAFNAGVAQYKNETLLLLRVAERPISLDEHTVFAPIYDLENKKIVLKTFDTRDDNYDFNDPRTIRSINKLEGFSYLTSLSYIRIARSTDGRNFTVDPEPFLYPFNRYQTFGIEDARVMQMEDWYYVSFTSVSEMGVTDSLIRTKDFETYENMGNILAPENKDVVLFPEKINGLYYSLHRPSLKSIGNHDIWIATSPDMKHWGNHHHLAGIREENWDSGRIGAGLIPIKTEDGWLEIYHGATGDHRYCMGAMLLDLDDPTKVLARSKNPIMTPEMDYEKKGFFGDVVFGCGGILEGDILRMYYGVSDTSMAGCELHISEILQQLKGE